MTRVHRIVSGRGGDCELIIGSEKTALIDCGMAYCAPKLVLQVKELLQERPLDYVIPTHTHYDHIGGMPYLRHMWPGLKAVGNQHGKGILLRENARKAIRELSLMASAEYGGEGFVMEPYSDDALHLDKVVKNGDLIRLGDATILVMETPGHTNCSLSYYLEEEETLFTGESIGCYCGDGRVCASVLTRFQDTFISIEKCRKLHPEAIVSCHYGLVEDLDSDTYFHLAKESAEEVYEFVSHLVKLGLSVTCIVDAMQEKYWFGKVLDEQPRRAFRVNATATVHTVARDLQERH